MFLKNFLYSFSSPTLIHGIWWSTAYQETSNEGYLRGIKKLEFTFPNSLGGSSFETSFIQNEKKDKQNELDDMEIMFFPHPILTDELSLSEFAFKTTNSKPDNGHTIRFSLELFGCSDYQPDISKLEDIHEFFSTFHVQPYNIFTS